MGADSEKKLLHIMITKHTLNQLLSSKVYPELINLVYSYYSSYCSECGMLQQFCERCATFQCKCFGAKFCAVRICNKLLCCQNGIRICDCVVPRCQNNILCDSCWHLDDYSLIFQRLDSS